MGPRKNHAFSESVCNHGCWQVFPSDRRFMSFPYVLCEMHRVFLLRCYIENLDPTQHLLTVTYNIISTPSSNSVRHHVDISATSVQPQLRLTLSASASCLMATSVIFLMESPEFISRDLINHTAGRHQGRTRSASASVNRSPSSAPNASVHTHLNYQSNYQCRYFGASAAPQRRLECSPPAHKHGGNSTRCRISEVCRARAP